MQALYFSVQGQPQHYKNKGQRELLSNIREDIKEQYHGSTLKGPVSMDILFHVYPPKALKDKVQRGEIIYPLRHTDQADKMIHLVMKYLQHIAFSTPSQVVDLRVRKIYNMIPHTDIVVENL